MTSFSCAIFPLPDMVAFPGRTIPLHIFEPRYRKMVAHCLERDLPVGVALADRLISKRAKSDRMSEVLTEDQSVYGPKDVFGVGKLVLKEVLDDGRILVDLEVEQKVRLVRLDQELPFLLGEVEPIKDSVESETHSDRYYDLLLKTSLSLLSEKYAHLLGEFINSDEKDLEGLVYHTMSWLYFEIEDRQKILEEPVVEAKAQIVLERVLTDYFNKKEGTPETSEISVTAPNNVISIESFFGPAQ